MKNTPRIDLNVYALKEIFKYLTLEQRSRCSRVCSTWHEAESYLKIKDLRIFLGVFRNENKKNCVFVKSRNQLSKVLKAKKFENLQTLIFFSFENSSVNAPLIDLRNFRDLKRLELNGHFYEKNIFITLLDNKIKLDKLEYLSAPIIHVNIINKIFPNLKHLKTSEILISSIDCQELKWTKLEYFGLTDMTDKIPYLNICAHLIQEMTVTATKLNFLANLRMNDLKKINVNCLPENMKFVIEEQIPLFMNIINGRGLDFKINGLPLSNLNHSNVFIRYPFKSSYEKLSKTYNLNRDDRAYFLDNFKELNILGRMERKIKLFKGGNRLNNLKILNFNPSDSPNNLIDKLFTKIPKLEKLNIIRVENLSEDFFNRLPFACPYLMSIHLHASERKKVINLKIEFIFHLECLTSLQLENFNLNINADFKFIVKRVKFLNHLITTNTFYNQKHVFTEFQKKAAKYPQIHFYINIDKRYVFSSHKNWNIKSGF